MRFLAHYTAPVSSDEREIGTFEFDSNARLSSRDNKADARMAMLEQFGKRAVAWNIDSISRIASKNECLAGQLELDFRPTKKKKRKARKEYW